MKIQHRYIQKIFGMYSRLLQNIFLNKYLSRYSSGSLSYQCLNPDTISLAIVISRNLVTINAKSKGTILVAIGVNTDTSNQLIICLKQDTIHTATIPWTINAATTRRDLVGYVNQTIAINWSMSQTGHDPHGYNPVNYQRHYHWAQSCELCQLDNSNQ